MEYQDIVTLYKKNQLDIFTLKNRLEEVKTLKGREKYRAVALSFDNTNFYTNCLEILRIPETPDKIEVFEKNLNEQLNQYYEKIINSIRECKAWDIMKLSPREHTIDGFKEITLPEKLKEALKMNTEYTNFLEYQKLADIKECYVPKLNDEQIKRLGFLKLMFDNFKNPDIKREFFCFDEKFLRKLIEFKKSKILRLDDFFSTKPKSVQWDYEKYSKFFSAEDFRDIADNLELASKTLKLPLKDIIESYSEMSESEAEQEYLDEEFEILKKLEEKYIKMDALKPEAERLKKEKARQKLLQTVREIKDKQLRKQKEEELKKLEAEKREQERLAKVEKERLIEKEEGNTGKLEQHIEKIKKTPTAKEQVNPLIFTWLERDDVSLTRRLGSKKVTAFFDKIKRIEDETGIRVSLFLVTNSGKEVTKKRLQEIQKKANAQGLPRLVEGALGGYSSFKVDKNGNITDIAQMSAENRKKIITLIGNSFYFRLPEELIDKTEQNYLRYQISDKKDKTITAQYLNFLVKKLLKDPNVKKQPINFLPYMEKNHSGIDVLLDSQVKGILRLSEYYNTKYYVAPGKTMKMGVDSIDKFLGVEKSNSTEDREEH